MQIPPELASLLARAPVGDRHRPEERQRWAASLPADVAARLWAAAEQLAADMGRRAVKALVAEAAVHGRSVVAARWLAAAAARGAA